MSDVPAPQTVAKILKEQKALSSDEDKAPVHFEFTLDLNPAQREIFNIIVYYTEGNGPMRTRLIGLFMAYGASSALTELRKYYPNAVIEMSSIHLNMYSNRR